jgi:hypothetical protein
MGRRSTVRFLGEVLFLVIVAAISAGLHFGAVEIGLAMAGGFVVVVVTEVAMARDDGREKPRREARRRTTARPREERALDQAAPAPSAVEAPEPMWRDTGLRAPGTPLPARQAMTQPAPEPVEPPASKAPPPPAAPAPEPPPPAPQPVVEPVPVPVPVPEPEPELPTVQPEPQWEPAQPIRWNLFELQSRARAVAGRDAARDEEWSFLFLYLRDFADSSGSLPVDFDSFVRESFAELVGGRT